MTVKPLPPLRFDPNTASQLACPACRGDLRLEGSQLVCTACGCGYPIADGIPVLIAERADNEAKKP